MRVVMAKPPHLTFVKNDPSQACESAPVERGRDMYQVIFRCPKTNKEFDSGFQAMPADMQTVPEGATVRLQCGICGEKHDFKFADARIEKEPKPRFGQNLRSQQ